MRELGAPDVLKIEDVALPDIKPTEVLVKVTAVGVAYHDIVQRNGTMRRFTKLPLILGFEIAGTVERAGELVRTLRPGEQICTKAFHSCGICRLCRNGMETSCLQREPVHGGYAEFVALPEEVCVRVPDQISPAVACMLGTSTGVALNAVRDVGKVRLGESGPGDRCKRRRGACGAVELAQIAGATVIAVTRSDAKRQALVEAGATHIVTCAEERADFSKEVKLDHRRLGRRCRGRLVRKPGLHVQLGEGDGAGRPLSSWSASFFAKRYRSTRHSSSFGARKFSASAASGAIGFRGCDQAGCRRATPSESGENLSARGGRRSACGGRSGQCRRARGVAALNLLTIERRPPAGFSIGRGKRRPDMIEVVGGGIAADQFAGIGMLRRRENHVLTEPLSTISPPAHHDHATADITDDREVV